MRHKGTMVFQIGVFLVTGAMILAFYAGLSSAKWLGRGDTGSILGIVALILFPVQIFLLAGVSHRWKIKEKRLSFSVPAVLVLVVQCVGCHDMGLLRGKCMMHQEEIAARMKAIQRNEQWKQTTFATWLMIWYGQDQGWWREENPDATRNLIDGEWKTLNWSDESQYGPCLDALRDAGISVVIGDLTNGWKWLDARSQRLQQLCAEHDMKYCIAENSTGDVARFETRCQDVWETFAGPEAPYPDTYFHYRGKPLIVCYAIRDWYNSYVQSTGPNRSKFSLVWASGEDSNIDKWGWQLEPWVGPMPSQEAMFVTSAVRWNPADPSMWRKSIAVLDYCFAVARENGPKYVVVGSYDDPTERNNWNVSDTSHCEPGRQIRDHTGALNPSSHYERVKEWTSGNTSVVEGGDFDDGAYRLYNVRSDKPILVDPSNPAVAGAHLREETDEEPMNGLFWLYHQGDNVYRIVALHSGLALEGDPETKEAFQNWDSESTKQRWRIDRDAKGKCGIRPHDDPRLSLVLNERAAALAERSDLDTCWRLEPVLTLKR